MQKSGFFNALHTDEGYDRKYNANDYSENLAVIIGNGVLRSENDDLKVTSSGMSVTVGIGRAWINGRWYNNDTPYLFDAVSAPISGQRYDRVMLRLDKSLNERLTFPPSFAICLLSNSITTESFIAPSIINYTFLL